ncbi:5'-methylthioadenosine/S-adenosylhomocysteine nucleosidase family protein [Kitasatospora griseola]|uniref:5'-methylthioadenosine/S-adenosylhomocysteine nucleosidase family protein n=1 Tax=Kitasatospora griseola TaxID=2064 RepID=UPI003800D004
MKENRGIISHGSNNTVANNAVGDRARVSVTALSALPLHAPAPSAAAVPAGAADAWDIGVVTILSEELRAVVDELDLERERTPEGLYFYRGDVATQDGTVRVVVTQSQSQGQRSAMGALENLRRHYAPKLLAVVGIGGGIHAEHARIGDVIVSTDVVYYENRKINPDGNVRHRGEHRQAPARVVHGVNAFFAHHRRPDSQEFDIRQGPIGSGEAVIADRDAEERRYLSQYNEKILAVDMEAGGLSQYCQENLQGTDHHGWIVIRGISDNADAKKGHGFHELAARNAAHVLRLLLPHLWWPAAPAAGGGQSHRDSRDD